MNRFLYGGLLLLTLGLTACSLAPSTGPLGDQLNDQANAPGPKRFDLITVDDRVVETLSARPAIYFHRRFKEYMPPPELPIAVGDMVAVSVWESSADGLFGPSTEARRELLKEAAERALAAGLTVPPDIRAPGWGNQLVADLNSTALGQSILQTSQPTGRAGTRIPDQQVGLDGSITIPYAGRIHVAGTTTTEAQHLIERRLAGTAIDPQALVIVKQSEANSVTVTGEAIRGARVALAPGGTRLLDVIAVAGGPRPPPAPPRERIGTPQLTAFMGIALPLTAPLWGTPGTIGLPLPTPAPEEEQRPPIAALHDTFVELSRGGVTATIPYVALVANPAENIFAEPGDVLTLVRRPKIVSVFGATGKTGAIAFDAERVSLGEALAKSGGLADNSADPRAVFLLRFEPAQTMRALGQPVGPDGGYPVVYRLDLSDVRSYALAKRFPVRDKDVIYVSNAPAVQVEKVFAVLQNIVSPIVGTAFSCRSIKC